MSSHSHVDHVPTSTTARLSGQSSQVWRFFHCQMRAARIRCAIVAESDLRPDSGLRVIATAANGAEAELLQQRLAQAGIQATTERVIGGPEWGESGTRYVYVASTDLERARAFLEPPGDPELGG